MNIDLRKEILALKEVNYWHRDETEKKIKNLLSYFIPSSSIHNSLRDIIDNLRKNKIEETNRLILELKKLLEYKDELGKALVELEIINSTNTGKSLFNIMGLNKRKATHTSFYAPAKIMNELVKTPYFNDDNYAHRNETLKEQKKDASRKNTIDIVDRFNIESIEKLMSKDSPLKIIDVGCAEGERTLEYIKILTSGGYKVEFTAVDYSSAMCEKAKNTLKGLNVIVKRMDMSDMHEVKDGEFDILLNLYGPIALVSPDAMSRTKREFYRVLKKGGLVCVDVLGRDLNNSWKQEADDLKNERNYVIYKKGSFCMAYIFSKGEVVNFFVNAGFKIERILSLDYPDADPEYMLILRK